ncbi:MAG: phage head closure protein [Pseudomonadota bacterium]|nr:phage head closure protein [Pseudomonadota bacterium]MEE3098752.1 phage head closure protein [Pseudomonadota bacterium]
MRSGDLDRRVTLQRATSVQDALGEPIQTWADIATVWAKKIESRRQAREAPDAGEARAALTRRTFEIRWSTTVADLGPLDRLVFEGRIFDILGVSEIGRREGLSIEAVARAE